MRLAPVRPGSADFALLERRIEEAGLHREELRAGRASYFALVTGEGEPQAFGGLLALGPDAMVQSVVVAPESRRMGLGARLLAGLVAEAQSQGVRRLWLLTIDATKFFQSQGFEPADRAEAPAAIAATTQFRDLCPENAVLMRRKLA